jgi:hypothetical protein
MAWGEQGEYKRTERKLTVEEVRNTYGDGSWEDGTWFLEAIRDGDELTEVREGDNHHGSIRWIGRRGSFSYVLGVYGWMS